MSGGESQEYQGQPEGGFFMSPKNSTTVDFTVTSAYDPLSVDSTDYDLILTREPTETPKPFSQSAADT